MVHDRCVEKSEIAEAVVSAGPPGGRSAFGSWWTLSVSIVIALWTLRVGADSDDD